MVWIVTVHGGTLHLVGRIQVGAVVDQAEAERRLQRADLWEAKYHAIATPGTEEALRDDSMPDLTERLTFESTNSPRLKVIDGKVSPQQLQAIRRFTREAGALLQQRWGLATTSLDQLEPPARRQTTTQRIIRDSDVAEQVKRLHGYRCQVWPGIVSTLIGPARFQPNAPSQVLARGS